MVFGKKLLLTAGVLLGLFFPLMLLAALTYSTAFCVAGVLSYAVGFLILIALMDNVTEGGASWWR